MEQLLERSSWSVIHPSAYFIVGFIVFLFIGVIAYSLCKAAANGDAVFSVPADFRDWDEPWTMTGMGRESWSEGADVQFVSFGREQARTPEDAA